MRFACLCIAAAIGSAHAAEPKPERLANHPHILTVVAYFPGYYCQGDVPFQTITFREWSTKARCERAMKRYKDPQRYREVYCDPK